MKNLRFQLLFIVLLFNLGTSQNAIAVVYMNCATQSYIPYLECNALVALYISTNGSDWHNSSGWLNYSDPCTSWYGVECRAFFDGIHVFKLLLNGNNLSGSIPPEISNLTRLNQLYLHDNQLSSSIPSKIGNFVNLSTIILRNNLLSGSIPSEIGNLTSLEILDIQKNQLSGRIPSEIGNLTNLTYLKLNTNDLIDLIPSSIGNLTNLKTLFLNDNQLCGEIPSNLTNLTMLYDDNGFDIQGINIKNNYLYTNDAALDAFLILKGGDWESSQDAKKCPSDSEKTLLYQIIFGASQK